MKLTIIFAALALVACNQKPTAEKADSRRVEQQQSQYQIGQPIPAFDWSLERDLVIQLYKLRNQKVATHSVWRSDFGQVEGDCPSFGYGIPYDTSLTNPLRMHREYGPVAVAIEQAEPNGVFASKNTAATWVMCLNESGGIEPVYVETKVTVYPGPVKVDYANNQVKRTGAATALIRQDR